MVEHEGEAKQTMGDEIAERKQIVRKRRRNTARWIKYWVGAAVAPIFWEMLIFP